ncbi:MAG: AAA family ATPase [Spirochaetales bacterium]|nr:AAA family ATPase [Spirochaetales bacterium]
MDNKLIVLRGPSASGKTTVAKQLFEKAANRATIIHQDYYRFIFKPAGGGSKPNSQVIHKMIEHNTAAALEAGYDVILEGILSLRSYEDILKRLVENHPGESHMFYFDISLEETIRRHHSREGNFLFDDDAMREWYPGSTMRFPGNEVTIAEDSPLEETVDKIIRVSRLSID